MNPLKFRLHRTAAMFAGALLGVVGAAAIAAPASAHHSEVDASYRCDTATGEWVVNWTVRSVAPAAVKAFKLTRADVTPAGSSVAGIAVTPKAIYPHDAKVPLTGEQRLAADHTSASLTVQAEWENGQADLKPKSKRVSFKGTCGKTVSKPSATFASDCTGVVVVTLNNDGYAKAATTLTVKGADGFKEARTLEPGQRGVRVTVPATYAKKIAVVQKGADGPAIEGGWSKPEGCVKPSEPEGYYESTCDELIFTLDNPKDGLKIDLVLTPNKGEAKTLIVKPGDKKSIAFSATAGLKVTAKAKGLEGPATVAWQKPDDDACAHGVQAGGKAGGKEEPSLPVTGPAAAGIAGGAVVLLILGAATIFVSRRRRVTFTA